MPKITKRYVESVKAADRDVFAWDDELRGFGVRVKPSGLRSYIVQYRNAYGRSKRMTIGEHGRLTAEEARKQARLIFSEVETGRDPAEARTTARKAPTLVEFSERYLSEHAAMKMRPKSAAEDRRMISRLLLPALGNRKLADITRADTARLHHDLRRTPTQANRVLSLLSRIMNLAERWGLRPDGSNPCRHVEKFKETKRDRYLSADELARLGDVLMERERTATEAPNVIAAVRVLILTGCRLSEILTLRWEHVDFAGTCLRLPDSKTEAKTVHLNAPALAVLSAVERKDASPWVIVGEKPGAHLVNLQKPWRRIRTAAGIPDVRLHDLRHSFASVAVGLGEGLPMIGKLLGHTQTQTTARYAHLAADPVKAATERVGAALAGMMGGQAADVLKIKPGTR
ncbi:Site-specific recombinase XerD [uncultured Defluviicoccus sp.]|uniref:Site-specific recombinase XerD n=1 Tax=metagenome TaxID=256318 RepID=A0A380TCP6_9ZZZZ|nr:Site-specific recombinase XerD [uncultured Defluviicoccus sp.]